MQETAEPIADLCRVVSHADAGIAELPLQAPATVRWWDPQESTVHRPDVDAAAWWSTYVGRLRAVAEQSA